MIWGCAPGDLLFSSAFEKQQVPRAANQSARDDYFVVAARGMTESKMSIY
jgi:hypothetical protein